MRNRPQRVRSSSIFPLLLYGGLYTYFHGKKILKKAVKYTAPVIAANMGAIKNYGWPNHDVEIVDNPKLEAETQKAPNSPPPTPAKRQRQDSTPAVQRRKSVMKSVGGNMKKRSKAVRRKVKGKRVKRNIKRKSYRRKFNRKYKKSNMVSYLKNGSIERNEITASSDDPDGLYFYVHALAPVAIYRNLSLSILRKLFQKSLNISIKSSNEQFLSGDTVALGAKPYLIRVGWSRVGENTSSYTDIDVVKTCTLQSLTALLSATNLIQLVSSGSGTDSVNNSLEMTKLMLVKCIWDSAGTNIVDMIVLGHLDLKEETVIMKTVSDIKIQNRSAASADASTTNINVGPLESYKYDFKSIPKFKYLANGPIPGSLGNTNGALFSQLPVDTGAYVLKMSTLASGASGMGTAGIQWKEPVMKNTFENCRSRKTGRFPPGSIMVDKLVYEVKLKFNEFLRRLNGGYNEAGNKSSKFLGTGILYCFEDMINISSSFDITITYQIDRVTSIVTKTHKTSGYVPDYSAL